MLANRKLDHLGLFTKEIEETVRWYCENLGFQLYGDYRTRDGFTCKFIRNAAGIAYELILPPKDADVTFHGRIDHIAYVSEDIEADYAECMEKGYPCTTDGVQFLENFWERGSKYFKIATSTGEEIEFCQVL